MGHIAHRSNIGLYHIVLQTLNMDSIPFCPTSPSGAMILTNLALYM
jgi:hypothetical protein